MVFPTAPENQVFQMQRLEQCPVNSNKVRNGTNEELGIDIFFKSLSLRIRRGILSGWKKGNCLRSPDYPLQKPIIWLKVLKESSSKINNIDYHPTVLFSPIEDHAAREEVGG